MRGAIRKSKKQNIENTKSFLTFSEIQTFLGVKSRKTILKYIKSGDLPAYKLGGTRWRISQEDINDFLSQQRTRVPGGKTQHFLPEPGS